MTLLFFLINSFLITPNPIEWQTNFDQAKEIASKEDKSILMVFSGSDWCAPCKKLKKNILLSSEFRAFEKEEIVVLYLDFPSKRKNRLPKDQTAHNEALAGQFNQSGSFPKVVLMDKKGNKVKEVKYEGQGAGDFIDTLTKGI